MKNSHCPSYIVYTSLKLNSRWWENCLYGSIPTNKWRRNSSARLSPFLNPYRCRQWASVAAVIIKREAGWNSMLPDGST